MDRRAAVARGEAGLGVEVPDAPPHIKPSDFGAVATHSSLSVSGAVSAEMLLAVGGLREIVNLESMGSVAVHGNYRYGHMPLHREGKLTASTRPIGHHQVSEPSRFRCAASTVSHGESGGRTAEYDPRLGRAGYWSRCPSSTVP